MWRESWKKTSGGRSLVCFIPSRARLGSSTALTVFLRSSWVSTRTRDLLTTSSCQKTSRHGSLRPILASWSRSSGDPAFVDRSTGIGTLTETGRLRHFSMAQRFCSPRLFWRVRLMSLSTYWSTTSSHWKVNVPKLWKKHLIPGVGHCAEQENPKEVNKLLFDFLTSCSV